jgi:hypothetical protein
MAWRLAKSLEVLRQQVNEQWPARSKSSDGTIGDQKHASRSSDHNPWIAGRVVSAIDITHDPAKGPDSEHLAETLLKSRDPRIKYIISNRKIASGSAGPSPWKWRAYTGSNPHNHHVHISVKSDAIHFDSTKPWSLDGVEAPPAPAKPYVAPPPTLRFGSEGEHVKRLQGLLKVTEDGNFGPKTRDAVKSAQKVAGIVADGVVGPQTWEALT